MLLVAGIAAVVSYLHIFDLALSHGQSWLASVLLPVSVDGTVAGSSLALLYAARNGVERPWRPWVMLGLGVGMTLGCNVAYGLPSGPGGALLSGWPAVAFIGLVEVVLWMIRSSARPGVPEPVTRPSPDAIPEPAAGPAVRPGRRPAAGAVRGHRSASAQRRTRAVRAATKAALAGRPVSARQLAADHRISRATAGEVLAMVRAGSAPSGNGHGPAS